MRRRQEEGECYVTNQDISDPVHIVNENKARILTFMLPILNKNL